MYKRRIAAVCCAVLALGLAVAACGDSGEEGPTREAFVRKANAVCFKANSKAGSEIYEAYKLKKVKLAGEAEGIDLEVDLFVPILMRDAKDQLEGIGALDVPSDEEKKVESLTQAYEAWLEKADDVPLKVVFANDIYNDARELAGKMGLVKCEETPYEGEYSRPSS